MGFGVGDPIAEIVVAVEVAVVLGGLPLRAVSVGMAVDDAVAVTMAVAELVAVAVDVEAGV